MLRAFAKTFEESRATGVDVFEFCDVLARSGEVADAPPDVARRDVLGAVDGVVFRGALRAVRRLTAPGAAAVLAGGPGHDDLRRTLLHADAAGPSSLSRFPPLYFFFHLGVYGAVWA